MRRLGLSRLSVAKISCLILCLVFSMNIQSAPGDVLFEEYFNNNGDLNSDWDRSDNNDVGVSNDTFKSSPRSAFLFSGPDSLTLKNNRAIDAAVDSATLAVWVRRGSDSFSEDPDTGEDLTVEYNDSNGTWFVLETFTGSGTQGEIFDRLYDLPPAALHDSLRLRFQNAPSNDGFDYWHVDDVIVTETGPVAVPDAVAEWRLDEALWTGGANEVVDQGADNLNGRAINVNGLPGTDIVTPARAGDPGTCRYGVFDGPNSGYVQINDPGNNSVLDFRTNLTVTTWVYPRSYPSSGLRSIVSKDENFEFHLDSNGRVFWWWGGGSNEMTSTGQVPLNTWTHVAIVYRNGEQQIYLNGILSGTHGDNGNLTLNNDPVLIGTDLGFNSRTFDGYIDEVRLYSETLTSGQIGVIYNDTHACNIGPDHYAISHSSPTVTCEVASVTITPHDSLDQPVIVNGVTISLTTDVAIDDWVLISGLGTLSGNQYTFDNDETSVELGLVKTTPAVIDIDVSDGTASDIDGGVEDPSIEFVDTAFKFYSDNVVDAIGTQISAKSSSQVPGAANLTIKAVRTNSDTGRCDALISGGVVDVGLAYECTSPSTCALSNHLTLNGVDLNGSNNATPLSYVNVPLNFDALGTASFTFSYADAGLISLHANADLAVENETVNVQGNSNDFVVRPAGLCVESGDTNASCGVAYDSCSVLRRAGDTFPLTISARAWGGAGETDTQFCNNAITPNFSFTSIPLAHDLVAPAGGDLGTISQTAATIASTNAGTVTVSQSVSEVGAFTFSADNLNDYLGASDADIASSESAVIGRFIPAQFSIQNAVLSEANGSFSYLSQPFDVTYDIHAENLQGGDTLNYTGAFAKIANDDTHLSYDALLGVVPVLFDENRMQASSTTITWLGGIGEGETQLQIDRALVLESPLTDLAIGARVDDTEGGYDLETSNVDLDTDLSASLENDADHVELGITTQRFARLFGDDVWGPESTGLAVPLQVQYWNGSIWGLSDGDETQIPRSDIEFVDSGGSSSPMISDPITAPVGSNPNVLFTYDPTGNLVLDFGDGLGGGSGDSGMFVGAPNARDFFSVDINLVNFPWLQFDWNQDGDFNDAGESNLPRFTVTFESYRGHDRVIYWREVLSPL
ncbi:MAG: hypothetical protein CL693_16610 [Cellvibrionaceae bacterium]|nr:hypothetical protein [Cellvibrionaceae bacterium]